MNYERTFEIKPTVLHIHGTETYYPVFGVGETYQIANDSLLSFSGFAESMIKPQSIQSIGELWYDNAMNIIRSSQIICINGMSLGESDSIWWDFVNQWLNNDSHRRLIIFWYSKKLPKSNSFYERIQTINFVKEKMLYYSNFSKDTIEKIKKRIHVIINTQSVLQVPASQLKIIESDRETELVTV